MYCVSTEPASDSQDKSQYGVLTGDFQMYIADARCTLRIIRTTDGKIMYRMSEEYAKGYGTCSE